MPPGVALKREEKRFDSELSLSSRDCHCQDYGMIWFSSIRFAGSGLSFHEWEMFYFVLQLIGTMSLIILATKDLTFRIPEWLHMIPARWCIDFLYICFLRSCRCGSNLFRIFAVNAPATATSCWEALRTLNKSEKSKHTTRENIACNNAELRPHIPHCTILNHIVWSPAASACEHTNMQIIVHTATTPTANSQQPTTNNRRTTTTTRRNWQICLPCQAVKKNWGNDLIAEQLARMYWPSQHTAEIYGPELEIFIVGN